MMVKLIVIIKKIKIVIVRIIKKNNKNQINITKENQCLFYGIMVGFKMYWHG